MGMMNWGFLPRTEEKIEEWHDQFLVSETFL
jgi:hypothetical protein